MRLKTATYVVLGSAIGTIGTATQTYGLSLIGMSFRFLAFRLIRKERKAKRSKEAASYGSNA